jgi:hypothetical protein
MLLEYQKHLSRLEKEIDALAKEIEEYKIIRLSNQSQVSEKKSRQR